MNDQERITDMILSEKKMSTNYNTFASECVDERLRDEYLKILGQSHMTQTALFKAAQAKGWYKVDPAPPNVANRSWNCWQIILGIACPACKAARFSADNVCRIGLNTAPTTEPPLTPKNQKK